MALDTSLYQISLLRAAQLAEKLEREEVSHYVVIRVSPFESASLQAVSAIVEELRQKASGHYGGLPIVISYL